MGIYSCGNTLTRKYSRYLAIALNYKGILPTVSELVELAIVGNLNCQFGANIVKTRTISKGQQGSAVAQGVSVGCMGMKEAPILLRV